MAGSLLNLSAHLLLLAIATKYQKWVGASPSVSDFLPTPLILDLSRILFVLLELQ